MAFAISLPLPKKPVHVDLKKDASHLMSVAEDVKDAKVMA
jgi:hypothetical protein